MEKRIPSLNEFAQAIKEGFMDEFKNIASNNNVPFGSGKDSDGEYQKRFQDFLERYLSGCLQYSKRTGSQLKLDDKTLEWLSEIYATANSYDKDEIFDKIQQLKKDGRIKYITQRYK